MFYIACISTDDYALHAAAMISSVVENNSNEELTFLVLSFGFCEENLEKMKELSRIYNKQIQIIKLSTEMFSDFPALGHWGKYSYAKLFIEDYVPVKTDRVIFLDVDMIVKDSIKELFEMDLTGYAFAAAEDMPNCISHKKRLNLEENSLYANVGTLLINLEYWRTNNIKQRCIRFVRENLKLIHIAEQDILNTVCTGKIKCLPIKYNMQSPYYFYRPQIFDKYLPDLDEARQNPIIIHYSEHVKPWHKECFHPLKSEYIRYKSKTPWTSVKLANYAKRPFLHKNKMRLLYIMHLLGLKKTGNLYISLGKANF